MPVSASQKLTALSFAAVSMAAAAMLWTSPKVAAQDTPDPKTPEYFTAKVQPILAANCFSCHSGDRPRGGMKLDSKAGILKGGHDGAVIVPGDAANSLLIKLIRHEGPADDPMPMPPRRKISDDEIATITAWVNGGAKIPDDK